MANEVLRNIRTSLTTTAAYGEQEVNLALSLESSFLYYVTSVEVCLDDYADVDDNTLIAWQIARASQSGLIGYNDSSCLWRGGWIFFTTTSGAFSAGLVQRYELAHPY